MAQRNFTSQFHFSFEKQLVHLLGKFTISTVGARASLVNQAVTYSAVAFGASGNSITIELVDPAAPSSPLAITVVGTAISVSLATDGASVITTDATTLVAALLADTDVTDLVNVSGSGASPLVALAPTPLAGGIDPVISDNLPIAYMSMEQLDETSYRMVLADKYKALLSCQMMLQPASGPADMSLQLVSEDVLSTKVIEFLAYAIGSGSPVLATLAAGDVVYVDLCLRNVS